MRYFILMALVFPIVFSVAGVTHAEVSAVFISTAATATTATAAVPATATTTVEYGQTIASAELKQQPRADALTLLKLPQKTRVEVLKRQGAWYQVKWLPVKTSNSANNKANTNNAAASKSAASKSAASKSAASKSIVGWLRMLNVRGEGSAKSSSGSGGLIAISGAVHTAASGTAVATGVRGLSEVDLNNAQPNFDALQTLDSFVSDPKQAREFANQVPLQTQSIPYLSAPLTSSKEKTR